MAASAAQAQQSARAAHEAQADANAAAVDAATSAQKARASAAWARYSAENASQPFQQARASARAAVKDAEDAEDADKTAKTPRPPPKPSGAPRKRPGARPRRPARPARRRPARRPRRGESAWTLSDTGHLLLDVARLGPGAGEFADGADCAWYGGKDDAVDVGLSCAPAVPVAAYGASTVKFGKWGKKALGVFKGLLVKARKACRVPQANSFTPDTPVVMADGRPSRSRMYASATASSPPEDRPHGAAHRAAVHHRHRGEKPGPLYGRHRWRLGRGHRHAHRFRQPPALGAGPARLDPRGPHPARRRFLGAHGTLRTVTITAPRAWAETRTVHNLTVAHAHTFYVRAGDATVRVHNDGGLDWGKDSRSSSRPGTPGPGRRRLPRTARQPGGGQGVQGRPCDPPSATWAGR